MGAGMLAEINTRIDVLLIGLFMNPTASGIYSFVGMLNDGLYHILTILRINVNPLLASKTSKPQGNREIASMMRKLKLPVFTATCLLSFVIIVTFEIFVTNFSPNLSAGKSSLIILMIGLSVVSPIIPFDNLMIASGFPLEQTYQQLTSVLLNCIVGCALIPFFGINGAAIGTVVSYCGSVYVLSRFSSSRLGWNILLNKMS